MTPEEAAKVLLPCKSITMMTGAGLSVASGVPTFRGQDGFWKETKQYAGEGDPAQILTWPAFQKNPMAVWEWHYDFFKLMVGKQPNQGHKAIREFQEYCLS